jgi:hypothetical protein
VPNLSERRQASHGPPVVTYLFIAFETVHNCLTMNSLNRPDGGTKISPNGCRGFGQSQARARAKKTFTFLWTIPAGFGQSLPNQSENVQQMYALG